MIAITYCAAGIVWRILRPFAGNSSHPSVNVTKNFRVRGIWKADNPGRGSGQLSHDQRVE